MTQQLVVFLGGATGSGKSTLAIEIARQFNGVLVNSDSVQLYSEIPILTAYPTDDQIAQVPHRLYGVLSTEDRLTAAHWASMAAEEVRKIWAEGRLPIVVGGTGLYFKTLQEGLSPIASVPDVIRRAAVDRLASVGLEAFYEEIKSCDPKSAARIAPGDTQRILRVWEVFHATQMPLSDWHRLPLEPYLPEAEFCKILLDPPRKILKERINKRAEVMISLGALKQVERLKTFNLAPQHPLRKALGVSACLDLLDGEITKDMMLEKLKIQTHQYAKRQATWFRHQFDADMILTEAGDFASVSRFLQNYEMEIAS